MKAQPAIYGDATAYLLRSSLEEQLLSTTIEKETTKRHAYDHQDRRICGVQVDLRQSCCDKEVFSNLDKVL